MKVFVNATAHELTALQLRAIGGLGIEDVMELPDELKKRCLNSPDTTEELEKLANDFVEFLKSLLWNYDNDLDVEYRNNAEVVLHLPVGSPAFMFILSRKLINVDVKIVFSHSERQSIEEEVDGKVIKKSIFNFKKFIVVQDDWDYKEVIL